MGGPDLREHKVPGRIILLEFPHEAEAYTRQCHRLGVDPSSNLVISLDPPVASWLRQQHIDSVSSLVYFNSESHARALYKSEEVTQWLNARFRFQDSLGISKAYSNALIWYSRYFVNHLLWHSELLSSVSTKHPNMSLQASVERPRGYGSPMVQVSEKYLGRMAEDLCRQRGVEFLSIETFSVQARDTASSKGVGKGLVRRLRRLVFRVGANFHRSALRRMRQTGPILVLASGYRMDALVRLAREQAPELPWTIRGESGRGYRLFQILRSLLRGMTGISKNQKNNVYIGEVWPQILERAQEDDPASTAKLTSSLEELAQEIEREPNFFRHNGVSFGSYFAGKVRTGIAMALQQQQRDIKADNELLELLQPRLVMTPFGRRTQYAMGELGSRNGIPGLLISHGSFGPAKCKLAQRAWAFHAYGMLHGSYSHAALQSPLAEAFAKTLETSSEFVPTGPLSWGWKVDREASQELRAAMLGDNADCRIITHAGTPKPRSSIHFHIFETPDEYIQGITELIEAVEQVPGTFLIVKFRPSAMSVDDLRSILPLSDRYMISVDESFSDVLGLTDLLVSFSSTTIEEALQNQVPVLLYGGEGRYQHIEAFDVVPGADVEAQAVYSIRSADGLADGLKKIIDANGSTPLPEELFRKYVYKSDQITPFTQLVSGLVEGQTQFHGKPPHAGFSEETGVGSA